ncbi:hypothetical protein FNV43_RR20410 [Rhamnella rubrinervis]|uniref:Uncharacterized protein n=1 Tax=Rhamnella rubrinervis TaxID=2594499 RepID=A0A8K0E0M4_9ROSA|nr:hypothetical protein FNV43_RR20410 [Rhamnella rubrinervis]
MSTQMENSNPMFSAAPASSSPSNPKENFDVFLSFRVKIPATISRVISVTLCAKKDSISSLTMTNLREAKKSPRIAESNRRFVLFGRRSVGKLCNFELVFDRTCQDWHVRKQEGRYGEAFKKHEEDAEHNSQMVQSWRHALKIVGSLAGWHITKNTSEPELIKEFIVQLSRKLDVPTLNINALFGINSRLEKFESCTVCASSDRVQFIGICGMGGIGKTTLAKAYYNKNFHKFDGSCFLTNVRKVCKKENGLAYLQQQLLSKVLKDKDIVIDDVDRGITRIKRRLQQKKVLIVLDDVNKSAQLEALADQKDDDWFGSGSIVIVTTRDKSLLTSNEISTIYETDILNSTEALQLLSWKAFRNINPPEMYEELCKQVMEYAKNLPLALAVLGSLYVERVQMIGKMNWIVLKISKTRILLKYWKEVSGSDKIEAIVTSQEGSRKLSSFKAMSDMKNLRLLMILDPYNFSCENDSLTPDLEYLSNHQLRFLQWDRFPYTCFPSSFRPTRLVHLKLVRSRIEKLWDNCSKPLQPLRYLKIIDLSYSESFRKFEDFKVVPNLERLILEGCKVLSEIDDSITSLEKLIILNLAFCKSLKKLPKRIKDMKSLEILNLYGCGKLCELPEDCGHLKSLQEVDVRGSGISYDHLPPSVIYNENIQALCDVDCNKSSDEQEDVLCSSTNRFNVVNNNNNDDLNDVEFNLDIGDDNNGVYSVQVAGEENPKLAPLAKRALEGDNSSDIIRQLKSWRTSTSTWVSVQKRFDQLTVNGLLHSSRFGECIGMDRECKEFAVELFLVLARRHKISGDSINKTQLRDFWEQISDESFDSRIQTFFDMMDKDADGRITENDVREMIILSASSNKLSNIQKQAEEYAALIMEELDPENLGYVTVYDLERLLLQTSIPYVRDNLINLKPFQENNRLKRWYDKGKFFFVDNWPSTTGPIERLIRKRMAIKILKVAVYPGNVLALHMSKPQGFKYKSGQYMFINCAAVSWFKSRPFYITSSPADDYLSVHIRTMGEWTRKLITVFSEVCQPPAAGKSELIRADLQRGNNPCFPKILIDGPYAAPAQDYKKYEVVLLVGLGIGAAPMVSIMKDIINYMKSKEGDETLTLEDGLESSASGKANKTSNVTRKAYYYWVTREQGSFDWFKEIMNEVAEMAEKGAIEVHHYCTSVYEEGDARSALIGILQSLHYVKNGVDVVSGTRFKSHFGGPNWRQVYNSIAAQHPDTRVGVFYCGSLMLCQSIRKLASDFSSNTSTKSDVAWVADVIMARVDHLKLLTLFFDLPALTF